MKRCYLVRHAQTAWNGENRLQGRSDLPLDAQGQAQALRLGAHFASRPLRAIFTSQLQRSRQTAAAIAHGDVRPGRLVIEPGLAEMSLGAWEGLTPDEIDRRFDRAYERWQARPSTVSIPDAEPLPAFRARARGALARIAAQVGEGAFVVVSHGGVIASLLADVLDADYDVMLRRVRLDNAGITALELDAGLPHVCWINAVGHLDGLALPPPEKGV